MFKTLYGAGTPTPATTPCPGGTVHRVAVDRAGVAYGNKLLADPQTIYVDGSIRSAMGTFVEHGGGTGLSSGNPGGYRLQIMPSDQVSGVQVGAIVNGIANQTTGKSVDLEVHPYMPVGVSFAWSKTLPVPDSEIANTFAVRNVVQDYMVPDWPQIQFTYDFSTYMLGVVHPVRPGVVRARSRGCRHEPLPRRGRKNSDHVTTPPGTPNSIQGVAVLGTATSEASGHPTMIWVVR